jgi:hypothetical protein
MEHFVLMLATPLNPPVCNKNPYTGQGARAYQLPKSDHLEASRKILKKVFRVVYEIILYFV